MLPDLVENLDLAATFEELLREHLIEAKVYEHLAASLNSGLNSEAVREK